MLPVRRAYAEWLLFALTGRLESTLSGHRGSRPRMARQSGWERRVNQDEKKQPGVGMIVAGGRLGKA
jgi:hypothetical protein